MLARGLKDVWSKFGEKVLSMSFRNLSAVYACLRNNQAPGILIKCLNGGSTHLMQ